MPTTRCALLALILALAAVSVPYNCAAQNIHDDILNLVDSVKDLPPEEQAKAFSDILQMLVDGLKTTGGVQPAAGDSLHSASESQCSGSKLQCLMVNKEPLMEVDFQNKPRVLSSRAGMVAADNGRCSEIGAAVMAEGGNAIDAAVAAALCEGVVSPPSSGLGGGNFINIRLANGSAEFINAREVAPRAAHPAMYNGKGVNATLFGGLSVAVPTDLLGLELAWQRHGKLPWSRLVSPSAELAKTGFAAHPYLVRVLSQPANYDKIMNSSGLREVLLKRNESSGSWRLPAVGELCCQRPALAALLEGIAAKGSAALYNSATAAKLAEEIRQAGGIITAEDILSEAAKPVVQQPLVMDVGPYRMVTPPPPSSAAVVPFVLRFLKLWNDADGSGGSDVMLRYHRLLEGAKHGFAMRMWLGDAAGMSEQQRTEMQAVLKDLASEEFTQQMVAMSSDAGALNRTAYGGKWNPLLRKLISPADEGTTHISVVDSTGNAVSITTTINRVLGSGLMSNSTGIIFNNQMGDFTIPSKGTNYTINPLQPNYPEPYKRPLSSMSPIIVTDKASGSLKAVVGGTGGARIISSTLQTLANLLLYNMTAAEAVGTARVHNQLVPNSTLYEQLSWGDLRMRLGEDVLQGLKDRGHVMRNETALGIGVAHVVVVEGGQLLGACDPRKDSAPAAPLVG